MMVTSNVRLARPLGEGGMGAVWVAEHQSLRTQVVVKFMARDLVNSADAIARFSREAAAASQVKSPHVVQMLDHGLTEDGLPYIVMELLEGHDLEQQIRASGKLEPREVVAVVAQLARALTKAHERGIVHRDIKPSNVFLLDAGGGELFVKLLDFGIAKAAEGAMAGSTTRTGSFVGSPYYMSPEQVVGAKTIDYRTDLWSLGVVAFEALTGEKPFYAETVGALALKIHRDPLPLPSKINPALPVAIDAWFARACAREASERFASAKEMAERLSIAVTGEGIAAGMAVESVPSPRRRAGLPLAATELADSGSGSSSGARSGAGAGASAGAGAGMGASAGGESGASVEARSGDARSSTGAGVGLVTTGVRVPVNKSGRWVLVAGILVGAAAATFAVTELVKTPHVEGGAGGTAASGEAATGGQAASSGPRVPPPPPPASTPAPTGDRGAESGTAAATATATGTATAGAGGGRVKPGTSAHPPASASATPPASVAATTPPPPASTTKPPVDPDGIK
jgi:serine/threonine-protein kinase